MFYVEKGIINMKCAIIGGSTQPQYISAEYYRQFENFASYCADNKIEITTGGCAGYPFIIGEKLVKKNIKVLGYSAAKNIKEHTEIFNHPMDGCSSFLFLDNDAKNMNYRFLLRSLPLISDCDIVIALEGNWGTLFELITGIICGKKIIIWQGFGGISDVFQSIYNVLSEDCKYNYGECIYYVNSIDEIKAILNTLIEEGN